MDFVVSFCCGYRSTAKMAEGSGKCVWKLMSSISPLKPAQCDNVFSVHIVAARVSNHVTFLDLSQSNEVKKAKTIQSCPVQVHFFSGRLKSPVSLRHGTNPRFKTDQELFSVPSNSSGSSALSALSKYFHLPVKH